MTAHDRRNANVGKLPVSTTGAFGDGKLQIVAVTSIGRGPTGQTGRLCATILAALALCAGCGRTASPVATPETPSTSEAPATTVAATTTTTQPPSYVVQSGDSLSVIAERFGVTTAALAGFNDISDLDALVVGQELRIPPADTAVAGTTQTTGS